MSHTERITTNQRSWLVGFRNTPTDPTIWLFSRMYGPSRLDSILHTLHITTDRWADHGSATMACIASLLGSDADETYEHQIYAGESDLPDTDYADRHLITWNETNPPPPPHGLPDWPTETVTTLETIDSETGQAISCIVLLPNHRRVPAISGNYMWLTRDDGDVSVFPGLRPAPNAPTCR
jgi:hypothetical protein